MSFNAKNLHYEKQEPAFLRRMRGAHDAAGGRHNVQIARPKKARLKTGDDDEDDPVIIDESGEVVGKAEFEGMQRNDSSNETGISPAGPTTTTTAGTVAAAPAETSTSSAREGNREAQQIADVGGTKKRKQARAIGIDASDGEGNESTIPDVNTRTTNLKSSTITPRAINQDQQGIRSNDSKPKKKAKKIKLSFDNPE